MKIILIVVYLKLLFIKLTSEEYCPRFCQKCSNSHIECSNFKSFSELNFTHFKKINKRIITNLKLNANNARLNSQLNINGLNLNISSFELKIDGINGIEISENPFLNYNKSHQFMYFHLSNSNFQFFYRNNKFDWICDLVISSDKSVNSIFSSFRNVFLGYFSQIYFINPICPVIFKNVKIDWLYISSIRPDNKLQFIQLNNTSSFDLNSRIKYLQIQSSNIDILDCKLLDVNVFKYLEKLSIEFSNLSSIEINLFKRFKYLKRINFWLYNLNEFLRSNLDWLLDLNQSNNNNNRQQLIIELNDESNSYMYPDEDFCLFKHFPHTNLVFPLINTKLALNCTCTIMYLLSNWKLSEKNIFTKSLSDCLIDFEEKLKDCDLDNKVKSCFRKELTIMNLVNSTAKTVLINKLFNILLIYIFNFILNK